MSASTTRCGLRPPQADEKRLELLTFGLTNRCSAIELFILNRWSGETRTHNPRIKSAVHLTIELRTNYPIYVLKGFSCHWRIPQSN